MPQTRMREPLVIRGRRYAPVYRTGWRVVKWIVLRSDEAEVGRPRAPGHWLRATGGSTARAVAYRQQQIEQVAQNLKRILSHKPEYLVHRSTSKLLRAANWRWRRVCGACGRLCTPGVLRGRRAAWLRP